MYAIRSYYADAVHAWAGHWIVGYTFKDCKWQPRVLMEYNYASGRITSYNVCYTKLLRFGLTGTTVLLIGIFITSYLIIGRFFNVFSLSNRPLFLIGILLIVLGFQIFAIGLIGERNNFV